MFLDVQAAGSEPMAFRRRLRLGSLQGDRRGPLEVEDARIEGQIVPACDGHLLRGRLEAEVRTTCARCLEPFALRVEASLLRVYVRGPERGNGEREERRLRVDEVPLTRYDGRRIDLRSLAEEQIYLEFPLKPICRESCLGLCPVCGANRNESACGCGEDPVDPRLATRKEPPGSP